MCACSCVCTDSVIGSFDAKLLTVTCQPADFEGMVASQRNDFKDPLIPASRAATAAARQPSRQPRLRRLQLAYAIKYGRRGRYCAWLLRVGLPPNVLSRFGSTCKDLFRVRMPISYIDLSLKHLHHGVLTLRSLVMCIHV